MSVLHRGILLATAAGLLTAQEKVDLGVISLIKQEAFQNSKVMSHLQQLTDVHGPRLTASPEYQKAAEWTVAQLKEWGIANARLEPWGKFGRSWTVEQYSAEVIQPSYSVLTARPLAWSGSTPGPVTAAVVFAPLDGGSSPSPKKLAAAIEKFMTEYKGKLQGRIVLLSPLTPMTPATSADFQRYSAEALEATAAAPEPAARVPIDPNNIEPPEDPAKLGAFYDSMSLATMEKFFNRIEALETKVNQFLAAEGAVGVLTTDRRSVNGMVFAEAAGSHKAADPLSPPKFVVTREQYNRLVRLTELKKTVEVRLNLKVKASDTDVDGRNIVAEIPGGAKKDEVVMIGAHFDSWHTGTGATDNATGSAVMIEVMRILKTLNLKMDRTVRLGLWDGEEQGLYGSQRYVKKTFGDPETMKLTGEHRKFSVYFNHDNGTGKIRGVYLQENDAARPIFEAWLAPFHDLGAKTITLRNTGGTDHQSFDAVGLPGFQFIQDPADYMSITHHSDLDVYDHVQPGDLMQASAIIASMVYHAATRPELFPRKALPLPEKR